MENTKKATAENDFEARPNLVKMMDEMERVSISVHRLEQLIKAEAQLDVVKTTYETSNSWDLLGRLALVFGPLPAPSVDDPPQSDTDF